MIQVLGLNGSLRAEAWSGRLLEAVSRHAPDGVEITLFEDLEQIPPYNADLDGDQSPPAVRRWQDAVRAADGLLLCSPEYNHSLPGVLHNAIDWVSRPPGESALCGKCALVVTSTVARSFGHQGHAALATLLRECWVYVVYPPAIVVTEAPTRVVEQPGGGWGIADPLTERLVEIQLQVLKEAIELGAGRLAAASVRRFLNLEATEAGVRQAR